MKSAFLLMGLVLFVRFSMQAQEDELGVKGKIVDKYTREIDKLAKNKKIQDAFESIKNQDARNRKDLIMLTEIEAPPFMEEVRAKVFADMLREAGADSVWIDNVGNVLALRKGKNRSRTVALDAHLDTVFPKGTDVKVRTKGDTLFAPGIGDDTRALIVIASVLRTLEEKGIETQADLLFTGSVGEEGLGDLRGVKNLFTEGSRKIDSWISIDGGDIDRVNIMGLGSYRYRVTFKGPGGHSWGAFGLANPQHALGSAIHNFTLAADAYTKTGAKTSYNVGRIGGGTSVNSIAFESWMEIDMRSESPERLNHIDGLLKSSIQKALDEQNQIKRSGPDLTVDIQKIGDRPSGELTEDLPLIQRTMAAVKYFGEEPRVTRGSTNSNIPIARGIPAVTIGRGGKSGNAHSLKEWWLDVNGYKAIQFALLTVIAEAEMAR
ncbi:MAG: M20/M25/M40 family metallo-hydrolase [Cyclobacteriaceae bacterium]|nr:M20/M25/M40 family metallo-hydrolase [Cyclobacteriaceae bacterium]